MIFLILLWLKIHFTLHLFPLYLNKNPGIEQVIYFDLNSS